MEDGIYRYNVTSVTTNNIRNTTELRKIIVHTEPTNITIIEPNKTINYIALGQNQSLNWSLFEEGQDLSNHIKNCSFIYNGIRTNLNQTDCIVVNKTSFEYVNGINNLTFEVTEEFNIISSNFTSWDYTIIEINQTFNNPVIELSDESFEMFAQSSGVITQALLNHNGTNYISNLLSLGGGLYQITTTIQMPSFSVNSNVTFFYNLSTDTTSGIVTQNNLQEVRILNVGDCVTYSNLLMNLSLFDEKTLESINGTIEFDLKILNRLDNSVLNELSTCNFGIYIHI